MIHSKIQARLLYEIEKLILCVKAGIIKSDADITEIMLLDYSSQLGLFSPAKTHILYQRYMRPRQAIKSLSIKRARSLFMKRDETSVPFGD